MIRFALACSLLSGSLFIANPSAADHLGPLTSPDDAREEIYNRIMTGTSLDRRFKRDWSKPDKRLSSDYRSRNGPKALVVCINWDASGHDYIAYESWSYSLERRSKSRNKRTTLLYCKQSSEKYSGKTCEAVDGYTCEVVDQNGKNVLVVPDDVIARYTSNTLASALAGSNQFDGAWEGSLRCGDCENCAGPMKKNVKINIEKGKFDIIPDSTYMGNGAVDDQGNVSIRWMPTATDFGRHSRKKFSFDGTYANESFKLKGQRGPRTCTIELSRVASPVGAGN